MELTLRNCEDAAFYVKLRLAECGLTPPDKVNEMMRHLGAYFSRGQINPATPERVLLTSAQLNRLTLECAQVMEDNGFPPLNDHDLEVLHDGIAQLIKEWDGLPPEIGVRAPINWQAVRMQMRPQAA